MSQSTEKSLGQVARQAYYGRDYWESVGANSKEKWEEVAQAVAAAVREQCAQACEQQRLPTQPPGDYGDASYEAAITDCVQAIRSMKP